MIEPVKQKVKDVLHSSDRLEVPVYQRKFEWRESEAVELIEDLSSNNDSKGTFLGTIILKRTSETDEVYEIVDGQQRLTTLSILYLALRMSLGTGGLRENIGFMLFTINDDNESQPVLKPSPSIKRLYNYIMHEDWDGKFPEKLDGKGVLREIKKLKPIYEVFRKYIDPKVDDTDWAKKLYNRINNSYFITLRAYEDDDIYEIFERSNARGLQLGLGDLLRNFVASNQEDGVFEAWQDISESADNSLPKILKYFIVSRYGYTPKLDVYKRIKSYVGDNSSQSLEKFLKELAEFTSFFVESQKDHVEIDSWVDEFLSTIKRIK